MRDTATQRQVDASQPAKSTWLSANAGSGKTKVLTDRVARLLLQGVDPQNILCMTFTKAAATDMQNRLFKRLGTWAMLRDEELRRELSDLGIDEGISTEKLAQARRLFATAVETPGGLKIQTIHSFCSSLLRRFPLEAGVTPQFKEMDDRAVEMICSDILEKIATGLDADIFRTFAANYSGEDFSNLTRTLIGKRDQFKRMTFDGILRSLNLPSKANDQLALEIAFDGYEGDFWPEFIQLLQSVPGKVYSALADRLCSIEMVNPSHRDLDMLYKEFLYQSSSDERPKWSSKSVNFPQSSHKNAVASLMPVIDQVHALMDRVAEAKSAMLALDVARRSFALHNFADLFLKHYQLEKERRGLLDFDDLILKARDLLTDRKVADWVLFKLDGGIDHILVDEAQDTSPAQWNLIDQLSLELTSGEGARAETPRTIFIVGDKKQSIYSFQGADPKEFDRMKAEFTERLSLAGRPIQDIEMEFSFRSAQTVLSLVDRTFMNSQASGFTQKEPHKAFKTWMPGRVDLWPVFEKPAVPDKPEWYLPVDLKAEDDPATQLANHIAETAKGLIGTPRPAREGPGAEPVRAGDIMILVQRRSAIFHEIIRACKEKDLPVAGADRLRVGAELAVRDIAAVLSFLATPEDDLSLATALRSPLFGWSEAELFQLAHDRNQKYLWAELRDRSHQYPATIDVLHDLRKQADFLRPYDMIERILTRHKGRNLLLSRLGPEAEDGIDALLSQAMNYEQSAVDSLTGFLVWMQTDDLEIKRQMDAAGDRIRVMTVHGAKGLESPIVILPDCAKRDIKQDSPLIKCDNAFLSRPSKDDMPVQLRQIYDNDKSNIRAERDRLLYVAMTRAEQWLIVAAAGDLEKTGQDWYSKVQEALISSNAQAHDFTIGKGLRLEQDNWPETVTEQTIYQKKTRHQLADHFGIDAKRPHDRPVALAPSDLGGAKALPGEDGANEEDAKRRGRRIHLLLEHLPQIAPQNRLKAAQDLLGTGTDAVGDQAISELFEEANTVFTNPHLSFLFSGTALVEVPVTANLAVLDDQRMHGVIDRLLVESDHVLAIDFKTNAVVPKSVTQCPLGLLRQMAAYAHALEQIYPDRRIETGLLWTRTATFMPIPHDLVTDVLTNTQIS